MSKEFEWPFSMSGYDGEYERACREVTKAGVIWLRKHPEALQEWGDRVVCVSKPSYREFEEALLAGGTVYSGDMFLLCKIHARDIFRDGWEKYVETQIGKGKKLDRLARALDKEVQA